MGDKSIPKDPMIFAVKTFFCICLAITTEFGGLRSHEFDFHRDPQNRVSD